MIEHDDSQLLVMEQRLRELWAVTRPKSALADEDKAVAEKLLGKPGASRLAATKSGDRYRYRPQCIQRIEFFYVPPSERMESGWTIEATQNHVRRMLGRMMEADRCALIIKELKRRGYRVALVVTEGMKAAGVFSGPEAPRPVKRYAPGRTSRSRRFEMIDQIKGFRHG